MRGNDDKRVEANPAPGRQKRPYAKPKLQEYGSIAKLTQSGGSTRAEPGGTLRQGACL